MGFGKTVLNFLRKNVKFNPPTHISNLSTRSTSAGGFSGHNQVQYQDLSGTWRSHSFLDSSNDNVIRQRMIDVKRSYPNFKVRVIDRANRVIDITP